MIDAPGPWGTGPFALTEGYSSLEAEIALVQADPLACVWLPTGQPRSERVVLEANPDHWNLERGPRLERVVFRNDLSPAEALELVCTSEGEVDIVTEVAPAAARRVRDSEHAKLVRVDAMRVLVGVINRDADGAPLHDVRVRRALNLAVDRDRFIQRAFAGYAYPLAGLTPQYAAGLPKGQQPYPHDAEQARWLLAEARWPAGRALRLAAPADLAGVARLLSEDFTASLGVDVELTVIPSEGLLAAQHALVEKVLPLPFDVLVHAWFDLSADAPPAVLHREFFHSTGAFRTGPPIAELEQLLTRFAVTTDAVALGQLATDIDRFVYDQALGVFLCAPQALYAVNRHVAFDGYAATFELAETEVAPQHWSRR
ncbi:MAG TPA: ABC transporter substrate-binding protein [Actinomycetes bacterium]|nr:ABC transporter substrate-binding protein [Actinomycetes bacterium]